jgi:hypothetical protein
MAVLVIAGLSITSCKNDKYNSEPSGYGDFKININYNIDGKPLAFDTIMYTNDAGNNYSVTRLQYYISGLKFYKDGELKYSTNDIFYIDAKVNSTNTISIKNIPSYAYDYVTFYIGIDNASNIHGNIPSTAENVAMEWPDMMGGGYHFIKLEGHYKENNQNIGFAMHLGNKDMQPTCAVYKTVYAAANRTSGFNLNMNINEWFRNPYTYNFSTDGVYTMGNMMLMNKIKSNGNDVFSAD